VIGSAQSLPDFEPEVLCLADVLGQPRDPLLTQAPLLQAWSGERIRLSGVIEIRDLSLTIQPGQSIISVGASASDQCTMARLIAGLYLSILGEILPDSLPSTQIPRQACTDAQMLDMDWRSPGLWCRTQVKMVGIVWIEMLMTVLIPSASARVGWCHCLGSDREAKLL
jgi:hypothetical protein